MTMRQDRVVQLGAYQAPLQAQARLVFACYPMLGRVLLAIQASTAAKSRFRPRRADVLQDCFVADQRLAGPVATDGAEQAVLDRIPLRGPSRIMGHRDDQAEL